MSRQIIFHGDYFIDFYKELDIKVKQKIQYVLELMLVVLFNGFQKKTPVNEIEKAMRLKKEYFESKKIKK